MGRVKLTGKEMIMNDTVNYAVTDVYIGTVLYKAGNVVRPKVNAYPFSDSVICGFTGNGYCRLARPYVFASNVGTTCAGALTGVEYINMISVDQLVNHFDLIQTDRSTV